MLVALFLAAFTACSDDPTGTGGGGSGGGGGGGGGSGPSMTTNVTVGNNFFNPEAIQVDPGATVTWTWGTGAVTHNVTFSDASIASSGNQSSGTFQSVMPSTVGTYSYTCTIHAGMDGSVQVQ